MRAIRHRLILGFWLIFGSELYFPQPSWVNPVMDVIIAAELRMPDRSSELAPVHYIDAKDYSPELLWQKGNRMTETVVVKGLLNTAPTRKWGSEEWIQRYGDQKVITNLATNPNASTHKDFYTLGESTLGEVDTDVQNGIARMTYALDEIFIEHPELAKEVEVERFGFGDDMICRQMGMLYGSAGAGKLGGLMYHNAGSSNFLMQPSGYKRVRMISNAHSFFMKPMTGSQYDSGYLASTSWDVIERLPTIDVILGPGDTIHFPSWVWHATETLVTPEDEPAVPEGQEERQTKLSIALTCRFPTVFATLYNDAMLELFRTLGFKYGIPQGMPAPFRWVPFMRLMVDTKNYLFDTMPPWNDLDDCWSSKRAACRRQEVNN